MGIFASSAARLLPADLTAQAFQMLATVAVSHRAFSGGLNDDWRWAIVDLS
ncbi:hypothetical protein [Sphingomonas faeni]|uniref:hypothetical protein n=1 Tax=Sphingomonas faeni TaxID=185950 RepID=UPI0033525F8B